MDIKDLFLKKEKLIKIYDTLLVKIGSLDDEAEELSKSAEEIRTEAGSMRLLLDIVNEELASIEEQISIFGDKRKLTLWGNKEEV